MKDSSTIEIKKSTGVTISVAVLVTLIVSIFSVGSWVANVNAQVTQNKATLESLQPKIELLNNNLNLTNQNVIKLQTILEDLKANL